MLSAKFEKMVYVTKHVVMRHIAGFAQEALAVVQSDQAAALDDGPELIIGQVARMRADFAGIGVRRDKRSLGRFENLPKATVVEMRYVNDDTALLHGAHDVTSEKRKSVSRLVAGSDGVLVVPGQGNHFHAKISGFVDSVELLA